MNGRDAFEFLPQETFSFLLSHLSTEELLKLRPVQKKWKRTVDDLLENPDLITSLGQDLEEDEVKTVIEEYQTTQAYRFISDPNYQTKSPWHFLNHAITLGKPANINKLANAFFSVVTKLDVSLIGNFITNFRVTNVCKAFLDQPRENHNHIQTLCHALLCNKIGDIDQNKLKAAILWARASYRSDKGVQSILQGLQITLKVINGEKLLPEKSTYYINLRGADLKEADLRGTDFRLIDLRYADLFHAKLSTDLYGLKYFGGLLFFSLVTNLLPGSLLIRLPVSLLWGLSTWLSPNSKDNSNLDGVDLRDTYLRGTQIGGSSLLNTKLNNSKLDHNVSEICEGKFSQNTFFENSLNCQNINKALDEILPYANLKQFETSVANYISVRASKMSRDEAIPFLQAAIAHPFFSPEARTTNWLHKIGNFNMMLKSGQAFFQSFTLNGKDILNKKLEKINAGVDHSLKPTLKRKFSQI